MIAFAPSAGGELFLRDAVGQQGRRSIMGRLDIERAQFDEPIERVVVTGAEVYAIGQSGLTLVDHINHGSTSDLLLQAHFRPRQRSGHYGFQQ